MTAARGLIKRSTAAREADLCVRTLDRRERDDPTFPKRIGMGPGGGKPYGYDRAAWEAWLLDLTSRASGGTADSGGAASRGETADTGPDTPQPIPKSTSHEQPGSGSRESGANPRARKQAPRP